MRNIERNFYRVMAELIFWFHVFCGFVLLFFWQSKTLYPYYLVVLIIAVIDNTLLDFCFLAKWECYFRKKLDPNLNFQTFFSFYFKKFFGLKLDVKRTHRVVLITLRCMLGLNIIYWIYAGKFIYS